MRFSFLLAACFALATIAVAADPAPAENPPVPAAASAEPECRAAALELAGAFSNDGYKIRDGYWFSELEPGKSAIIQVNLFAGNEYWFCAASSAADAALKLTVFDETGALVDQQEYQDGARAAAGVVADRSGPYFVRVSLTGGAAKSPFCFIYCYK